jgi:2'-hydroxyisoflavone reductase
MRVLVLGGSVFLGRTIVDVLQKRGHQVTTFNRGKSNPDLHPRVEKFFGDRSSDLSALSGKEWDACIDTCGYIPRIVDHSARFLADLTSRYTFISSVSVYADLSHPGINEDSAVAMIQDHLTDEITGETYGPLKALCERAVEQAIPGRTLIVRPGLIVGPHDPTDRFTYWPVRISHGRKLLLPGRPQRPVQYIDVRDLADWIVQMIEKGETGIFNATGPRQPLPFEELIETCREISRSNAEFIWVSELFIKSQRVSEWTELPLWVPESDPANAGFFAVDINKALARGLTFRPAADTVRDTLAWATARPADYAWRAGLTAEREDSLLALWENQPAD